MPNVTNIDKPTLFASAPALPTGFHYNLELVGVYNYPNDRSVYKISIVRESDEAVVYGSPFKPSGQYTSTVDMITQECNTVWNTWNNYHTADQVALTAQADIGF